MPSPQQDVADLLPPDARTAFQQARKSLRAGIYDGAVALCLRSLEEATVALGAKGKTLEDRIESVMKSEQVGAMLREWAQSRPLRELLKPGNMGSEAGHAAELAAFCELFFECAFTLPAKLHETRHRLLRGSHVRTAAAAPATQSAGLSH